LLVRIAVLNYTVQLVLCLINQSESRLTVNTICNFWKCEFNLEIGHVEHECESEILCRITHSDKKIPYFNAPIYLENKRKIGKVDEILGPINKVFFTVKPDPGVVATSFEKNDVFYIGSDKLLPLERFTNPGKPSGRSGANRGAGRGFGGRGGRGRSGFSPRGGGRGSFGGRGFGRGVGRSSGHGTRMSGGRGFGRSIGRGQGG